MSTDLDDLPPPPPPPPRTAVSVPSPAPDDDDAGSPDAEFRAPVRTCPNCGAPVHGPYCHACGQSEKGMVRSLREVVDDLADIVFNVDSRVFRSLFDLYFRPGFLTTEYIEGRRARYVTPFRLFFVLSLVAFFAMQSMIGDTVFQIDRAVAARAQINEAVTTGAVDDAVKQGIAGVRETMAATDLDANTRAELGELVDELADTGRSRKLELAHERIAAAATATEVDDAVASGLALLSEGVVDEKLTSKGRRRLEDSQRTLREAGDERKAVLAGTAVATAETQKPASSCGKHDITMFSIDGKPWNLTDNPAAIGWLPDAANAQINDTLQHMCENIDRWAEQPSRGFRAMFSVLPQTLFFLMPWFALLLKVFYLFKRRLYMEHLLVALHSHAFLLQSIIVLLVLSTLRSWAGDIAWITAPLGWLMAFAWIWAFVYLFWMQKRVYRQGWIMTTLKFCMIGFAYIFLLSFGAIFAAAVSLAVT